MRLAALAGCRRCRLTTEERPGRAGQARVRCGFAEGRPLRRADELYVELVPAATAT
jgi:hypothetical protein